MAGHDLNILIVEEESDSRALMMQVAGGDGRTVLLAVSLTDAVEQLKQSEIDCVVCNLLHAEREGADLLHTAMGCTPPVPVIVVTDMASAGETIEAMRIGAIDYLAKPLDPDALRVSINRALERKQMLLAGTGPSVDIPSGLGGLIGSSEPLKRVVQQIRRAAPFSSTVLISGESGTGKELVARAIHALSPVSAGPFVAVNCSSLPRELVESQLFGHEQGAFTGATKRQKGYFESSNGGTLFLDEIGDLALEAQAKVLRAVESREIVLVGSTRPMPVDIRLLAATNVDLHAAMQAKTFREDLYYRLNVLSIDLPPLRERHGDVPILVGRFLNRLSTDNQGPRKEVTPEAMRLLDAYSWPGNVRELKNLVERLYVMSEGDMIEAADLPGSVRLLATKPDARSASFAGLTLEQIEKSVIMRTLEEFRGGRQETADRLGISVRTLQRRLLDYGLQ